jgi:SAM-dependent methyltransferase
MTESARAANQDQINAFLERVVADGAAAVAGVSTSLGGRLGLYRAMAGAGPLSSLQLADRTGLVERYVREWLGAQVAGEYVVYDPDSDTYVLPEAHAAVLADSSSPAYSMGSFFTLQAMYRAEDALVEAFRTGDGFGWEQHAPGMFEGTAALFRTGYEASLVAEWLPSLDGVVDKLGRGAVVADVGCGFGYSTVIMARAFPASRFIGFDFHRPSIEAARRLAVEWGVADRVNFEVAAAQDFPAGPYDLVTFFDCLHDLGDPGGALRRAENVLAEGGTCMLVEPNVSANPLENINPIGRSFASSSVVVCLPSAMAQHGPQALGNHPGEDALRTIAADAGLHRWGLAAETPGNRVYQIRR